MTQWDCLTATPKLFRHSHRKIRHSCIKLKWLAARLTNQGPKHIILSPQCGINKSLITYHEAANYTCLTWFIFLELTLTFLKSSLLCKASKGYSRRMFKPSTNFTQLFDLILFMSNNKPIYSCIKFSILKCNDVIFPPESSPCSSYTTFHMYCAWTLVAKCITQMALWQNK